MYTTPLLAIEASSNASHGALDLTLALTLTLSAMWIRTCDAQAKPHKRGLVNGENDIKYRPCLIDFILASLARSFTTSVLQLSPTLATDWPTPAARFGPQNSTTPAHICMSWRYLPRPPTLVLGKGCVQVVYMPVMHAPPPYHALWAVMPRVLGKGCVRRAVRWPRSVLGRTVMFTPIRSCTLMLTLKYKSN